MKKILLLLSVVALCASCSDGSKTIVASADSTKVPIDTLRKPPMGKPNFSVVADNTDQDTIRK